MGVRIRFEGFMGIQSISIHFMLLLLLSLFGGESARAECSSTCNGTSASVTVDLQNKCMCIKGKCFLISIGKNGPSMTTGGAGKLGEAKGAKYQTKPGPGSTGYDNDAIAMGIPSNDAVGKWIHKTRGCSPGGSNATKGCIAVPCEHWPDVKKEMGEPLMVCGGSGGSGSRGNSSGGSSGSRVRSGKK